MPEIRLQRAQVCGSNQVRPGTQICILLKPLKADHAVERKADFIRMDNVEHNHFMALTAKMAQPSQKRFHVIETIGDQKHQAAPPQDFSDLSAKLTPTVVNVSVRTKAADGKDGEQSQSAPGAPFDDFMQADV